MFGDLTVTELNEGIILLVSTIGGATAIGKFYSNSMKKVIKEQSLEDEKKINDKFDEIILNISGIKQDVENLSKQLKKVDSDTNTLKKATKAMLKHMVYNNHVAEMQDELDNFENKMMGIKE